MQTLMQLAITSQHPYIENPLKSESTLTLIASECQQRYKDGTVKALIRTSLKISLTCQLFNTYMEQLKQY